MADLAVIGIKVDYRDVGQADKALDRLGNTGAATERQVTKATGLMNAAMVGLAAAVAAASLGLSKLVSVAREFDVLNAQLKTATGSAEAAASAFEAIDDFARTTPYSLQQATKAFNQLVNLGLTPSEKALRSYGNTASAMGKDLTQMVEAVADATVGEFERLKEFGIKARAEGDQVSFRFRGVTTTVKNSAEDIERYLIGLGEVNFASAMADRMANLDGAISNLSDNWNSLFRNVANNGVGKLMADSVGLLNEALSEVNASFESGEIDANLRAWLSKFDAWGADIATMLTDISDLFSQAGSAWGGSMTASSQLIVDAFKYMPENIRAFIQIATVEYAAFLDRMYAYRDALADALNPFSSETLSIEDRIKSINQAREESLESIMNERDAAISSFEQQIKSANNLREAYDKKRASVDKNIDRLAAYKVSVEGVTKATKEELKEMERLDDALEAHFEAQQDLVDIQARRIENSEEELESMLNLVNGFDEYTSKIKETESISEKAAERIESAFADAWMNAFDGFESVVDGMKNAFKRMLAEMAHMALTKPIMVSLGLGGLLPGAANASGAASAASGLGLLGGIGGALTSAGGFIGGSFGGGLAASGGLLTAGNFSGMFSAVGSLISSGSYLSALGAALPIAGIAAAAAGIVDKITGGGLFGSSWKEDARTISLSINGVDVSGSTTVDSSKKKSLFRGTKRSSTTTALATDELDDVFESLRDSINAAGDVLGVATEDFLAGFRSASKIDIKGKTEEEVNQLIQDWISTTSEAMINGVFGDYVRQLGLEGETATQTLDRLAVSVQSVSAIAKSLGLDFNLTGLSAAKAATSIIDFAGGLDALAQLSMQYYQAFYTEAERQQVLATDLAAAFASLGVAMPASREGFRSLVDGLDLSTESGQKLFAELMKLVPSMDQYLSALEQQNLATQQAAKEEEAAAKALAEANLKALQDNLSKQEAALRASLNAEINSINEALNVKIAGIQAEKDLATEAHNARAEALQDEMSSAREMSDYFAGALSEVTGLQSTLAGAMSITEASASIAAALAAARQGDFSQVANLQSAVGAIASGSYASATDALRARAVAQNQLGGISALASNNKSVADRQLSLLQAQIDNEQANYEAIMAKYDEQIASAKESAEQQIKGITEQVNAILGADESVKTLTQAIVDYQAAKMDLDQLQIDKLDGVIQAVVNLGDSIKSPSTPVVPPDSPIFQAPINSGDPVARDLIEEVKKMTQQSGFVMESVARSTASTAKSLQRIEQNGLEVQQL